MVELNTNVPVYVPAAHHRRSVRLTGYDYASPGAYFVTVVTNRRECLFGEVVGGEMKLNRCGDIAKEEWFHTESLRPYIQLHPDAMVVMPNHIHGIIWIDEIDDDKCGRGAASLRPYTKNDDGPNVTPRSLGAIIRAYKSSVTYRINELRGSRGLPVWQRNYYEHIIRDQSELEAIAKYMLSNPDNWAVDPENCQ